MSSYHYLLKVLHYHYLIVDLFGLTLDNSLNFGKHITKISKKVGKQLDVLCRLTNKLLFQTKQCLYNSFIMSHFHYFSSIWRNCLKSDSKKLDRLHKRALRYLYSDESSQTSTLCDRIGYSLENRRIQILLIIVFKTIKNYPPEYLRDLFRLRDNIKNLRGRVKKLQVRNLYDSLWQELSKALTGCYLERDNPKLIDSFLKKQFGS